MIAKRRPADGRDDLRRIGIAERARAVVQVEAEAVVTEAVRTGPVKLPGRIDQALHREQGQFPLQELGETEPDGPGGVLSFHPVPEQARAVRSAPGGERTAVFRPIGGRRFPVDGIPAVLPGTPSPGGTPRAEIGVGRIAFRNTDPVGVTADGKDAPVLRIPVQTVQDEPQETRLHGQIVLEDDNGRMGFQDVGNPPDDGFAQAQMGIGATDLESPETFESLRHAGRFRHQRLLRGIGRAVHENGRVQRIRAGAGRQRRQAGLQGLRTPVSEDGERRGIHRPVHCFHCSRASSRVVPAGRVRFSPI